MVDKELSQLVENYNLNKLIQESPPEAITNNWHAFIIWKTTIQSIEALIEYTKKAA